MKKSNYEKKKLKRPKLEEIKEEEKGVDSDILFKTTELELSEDIFPSCLQVILHYINIQDNQ